MSPVFFARCVHSAPRKTMPDSTKATRAAFRALLDQLAKIRAKQQPQPPPAPSGPVRKTRVNVREFLRDKEGENWWDSSGDGDPWIGLRPRRRPCGPRRRR